MYEWGERSTARSELENQSCFTMLTETEICLAQTKRKESSNHNEMIAAHLRVIYGPANGCVWIWDSVQTVWTLVQCWFTRKRRMIRDQSLQMSRKLRIKTFPSHHLTAVFSWYYQPGVLSHVYFLTLLHTSRANQALNWHAHFNICFFLSISHSHLNDFTFTCLSLLRTPSHEAT